MKRIKHKKGDKINGLIYLKDEADHECPSRKSRTALFQCYCGKKFIAMIQSITSGNTRSCGCYGIESRKKRFITHGKRNHKLYGIWCQIKTRCYNKNALDYKYYGGRGITLSAEFLTDFGKWLKYVESLPMYERRDELKLTIDRIDNDKGHERGNLRWATRKQQSRNQQRNSKKFS